ncbi:ATP-dependent DNA ligase [Cryobacterium tepidiphilum]|uniref:DNA ligase (ATP) n=1 Tax=Cryobacterium tepidiphilum TaxID=2486026 RepID=A0A3M8L438_9MICO|nr:ATP-dependent DNA ligase [Cryobacterium tepidiphilum]RNE59424.1 ATP-dependent DNA ligase [Cryobacterium tepidiphilum]
MPSRSSQVESSQVVSVDGHRIKLTNLDKVLYPATGTTKSDVLRYYAAVAEFLIPYAAGRPATRKRWVHGVGTVEEPGSMFFQKNLDESAPDWVARGTIRHANRTIVYPLVNDLATLTWLAQIAALEIHVPQWRFGADGNPANPDRLVLDLDPGTGAGLPECAEVARLARPILHDMGLEPMPVTSGSKGIHLYAALDGRYTSTQVSDIAHELARALEADHKHLVVSDMKKELRTGKVLVDWSQNNAAKTTIAPYSLRGRAHPTVAVPRTWEELAEPGLAHLDYEQVIERMAHRPDPLARLAPGAPGDRLELYRSKRDREKTPEPVPALAPAASTGQSFVIQEHHARRLHWDFRLEHDGVLVSWALPRGVPTDVKKNHLAVQTEDHPLEYGSFEGTIPAGEYGGGEVTIWDSGVYELEKWRENEVIATLHGREGGGLGGPTRVALIHTGGQGKDAKNWLIHRMRPEHEAKPPAAGQRAEPARRPALPPRTGSSTAGRSYSPMLATPGDEADLHDSADWAFEMKWDGIRALAYVETDAGGRSMRLVTRNGNDVTVSYPDLADDLLANVDARSAVLDGEIVALDPSGRPDFGLLQTRMKLTAPGDVRAAARKTPVRYLVFDVLERDGEPCVREDYDTRRRVLDELVASAGAVQVPPAFDGDFAHAFDTSRQLGLEGVLAKERDSDYSVGRRSGAWIKIKHHLMQEVVVGGWKPGSGRRAGTVGSLLLGIPGPDGLRYVGKVGTGFQDRDLDEMRERFAGLRARTTPFTDIPAADAREAHWVEPTLVGEVEFAEWTGSGRLRQPSWRGWRPDKSPSEVVRE